MVMDSPQVFQSSTLIAKLVLGDAKLPAIFTFTQSVEAGGLMAYSFDLFELNKRVANNIDAILRGAKPGDIPIYQVYCGPVLRHSAEPIQAANFRSAVAF